MGERRAQDAHVGLLDVRERADLRVQRALDAGHRALELGKEYGFAYEAAVNAHNLGETYLREHPTENDGELLVNAVFDGTDDTGGGDLTESLRGTVKAEHAEGDVVEADGWRLARTEARLAALVYLSEQC